MNKLLSRSKAEESKFNLMNKDDEYFKENKDKEITFMNEIFRKSKENEINLTPFWDFFSRFCLSNLNLF